MQLSFFIWYRMFRSVHSKLLQWEQAIYSQNGNSRVPPGTFWQHSCHISAIACCSLKLGRHCTVLSLLFNLITRAPCFNRLSCLHFTDQSTDHRVEAQGSLFRLDDCVLSADGKQERQCYFVKFLTLKLWKYTVLFNGQFQSFQSCIGALLTLALLFFFWQHASFMCLNFNCFRWQWHWFWFSATHLCKQPGCYVLVVYWRIPRPEKSRLNRTSGFAWCKQQIWRYSSI